MTRCWKVFRLFVCLSLGLCCVYSSLLADETDEVIEDAPQRPNVLLIVSDDLTTCLGCYGNATCQTPHLDRLAKRGVLFERAYCQYPVCGPSRASFMSGLYPRTTRMLGNSKRLGSYRITNRELADHPSIGGFLRRQGYYSARVSKIFHMGIPGGVEAGEPGGDDPDSWDFAVNLMAPEHYSQGAFEILSPKKKHLGSNFSRLIVPDQYQATQADHMAATQAIGIMENRSRVTPEQPFFLAVGFIRPHVPLIAPKRLFDVYPDEHSVLPEVVDNDLDDVPVPARQMDNDFRYGMNKEQQKKAIAGYYASVSFMDEQVGRLLDALDRLQIRDNTIVIFTSDHGYNLGEHNCWQKLSLFDESTRVPLIISEPLQKQSHGKVVNEIVELIDLYPTIADSIGLMPATPSILQGESLKRLLEDPGLSSPDTDAYTVSYRGTCASLRTERWRYSIWGNEGEELYDHHNDPEENRNLAQDFTYLDVLIDFRTRLHNKQRLLTP